jgi:hypothetical protein
VSRVRAETQRPRPDDSHLKPSLTSRHSAQGLSGCEAGNYSHYFQGVARREPRHRLEALSQFGHFETVKPGKAGRLTYQLTITYVR